MKKELKEYGWKKGIHISSDGTRVKISGMATTHLENVIRKYKKEGLDVSILQKELNKRNENK
jgi:hypothetical protein